MFNSNSSIFLSLSFCVFFFFTFIKAEEPPDLVSQTTKQPVYLRITLEGSYTKPMYFYIFADHYRSPWYSYHTISKAGFQNGLKPEQTSDYFANGEVSPWCDISSTLYEETGAILRINAAYSLGENAEALTSTFEFATAPEENAIVKTVVRASTPPFMYIVVPPDFSTPENIAKCKTDSEYAQETGQTADNMPWPAIGKNPVSFPFIVFSHLNTQTVDRPVMEREMITLSKFGFNGRYFPDDKTSFDFYENYGMGKFAIWGNMWGLKEGGNYLSPKINEMKSQAKKDADVIINNGGKTDEIAYALLMDEPTGPTSKELSENEISSDMFRTWLSEQGKSLTELFPGNQGAVSWDMVRPVLDSEKESYPALYYYTQKFRTYSLGYFMQIQKEVLHEAYGADFPVTCNFSDGDAIYRGNFYTKGIDYFELMETTSQNAIWSEDWANFATTYQLGAYNVDLMRGAARKTGAHIGHYLISYTENRKPWDIKLKAISSVTRGVNTLTSFYYGPVWSNHSGHPVYSHPERWFAHAELIREIGGAEELLCYAKTPKADVALLYSSSTDIWTLGQNHLYGFERMHNWLALTHDQIPVDVVSERDVEDGWLDGYTICYLSGPNITEKAAEKLKEWVSNGGTLVLTAGAATKNEYNFPLTAMESILPANRAALEELEFLPGQGQGRNIRRLNSQDKVSVGAVSLDVLGVRQKMTAKAEASVLGTFTDNSPALVKGAEGKGSVYCFGFFPSLFYIREALMHRIAVENSVSNPQIPDPGMIVSDEELIGRSYNPWKYAADVRNIITKPFVDAGIERKLTCNTPLVDAKVLEAPEGWLIPLSNYTLQPISDLSLNVKVTKQPVKVVSVHNGELDFAVDNNALSFSTSLQETDMIKIYFKDEVAIEKLSVDEKLHLIPNPAVDKFYAGGSGKLEIYTLNGVKVMEYPTYRQGKYVDISAYPDGVYIVKLTNNKININKLIKQ